MPYLLLLCADILSSLLGQNTEIKSIGVRDKEVLLAQFADDTTLFLDSSEQSFSKAIWSLQRFAERSSLKVNDDKGNLDRL